MAPEAPLLTGELLARFEDELRRRRAPALAYAQPGLSDEAMDALVKPLGLRLPAEARAWWAWHNGTPQYAQRLLLPWREWLSLEEAVWRAADVRERYAGELLPDDSGPLWPDEWLPITRATGDVVLDCRAPDIAPVHLADYGALAEDVAIARAPSLGQLVIWWTQALAAGAYIYVDGAQGWVDGDKQPAGLVNAWL